MALAKDTPRKYDPAVEPMFTDLPVKASSTCYEGAAVTDDGGNGVVDGALSASENFVGFVERGVINSVATDGVVRCKVRMQGIIKDLAVTGVTAATDYGIAIYATDNGTFTTTSSTTFIQIGKLNSYNSVTGFCDVFFQGLGVRSI